MRWSEMMLVGLVGCCLAAMPVFGGAGGQGQAPVGGKPGKLGVPANVTCTKVGDQVTVMWEPVNGAMAYRVMLEAGDEGDEGELVETVDASPYSHAISDLTDDPTAAVTAKIRAMATRTGKGASKPSKPVTCQ